MHIINELYTSPNNKWLVSSQRDLLQDKEIYTLWKDLGDGWEFHLWRWSFHGCVGWLRWNKIISTDELRYAIQTFENGDDNAESI